MRIVLIALALMLLLGGCGAQSAPVAEEKQPAAEAAEVQPEEVKQPEAPEIAAEKEAAPAAQGFVVEDGKLHYYVNGEKQTLTPGLCELDGERYYVLPDGETIADHRSEVKILDGIVCAFGDQSALLPLDEGVQELFGRLYYVEAGGLCPAAGPLLKEDGLYFVQEDGTLLQDGSEGYLYFGDDGRYTSGDAELDGMIEALLESAGADRSDSEGALRTCYVYLRDNYKYLSMEHFAAGSTDWAPGCAGTFLTMGKGNCYCWAAAFMYCARRLGYQAYAVAGWESNPANEHAWVMIDWPDGETYLFDPQLEYAYWYMFPGKPKIDMFKASYADGLYNNFAYYFPQ